MLTFGEANTLGALLWPIEGNRWNVALGGRHSHQARPADFDSRLKFSGALGKLIAEDEAVHRLVVEVNHPIKPRSAYPESGVTARVMAMIT